MISTDKYFQGEQRKYPFFEGWYFKQQIEKDVYAFIPGYSVGEDGLKYPFIQVINHEHSEMFYFEPQDLWIKEDQLFVKIGTNVFSEKGLSLSLKGPNLTIQGTITFGDFTVLNKSTYSPSIMGPFSYLSFMECYHGILSMRHSLKGTLVWNGKIIDFTNGIGYLEKDWGSSFPATYLWAQCNQFATSEANFFFSAAEIPFMGSRFLGIISVLHYHGKEYRFATYYGAKIMDIFCEENQLIITIKQKQYILQIKVLQNGGHPLMAPHKGLMNRVIREKASTEMTVTLQKNKQIVFHQSGIAAGFEQVGNLHGYTY